MSTPLSLSLPETGALSVVSAAPVAAPADAAATPMVTEQAAVWTVLGVVTAAATAGIIEVILHLAG